MTNKSVSHVSVNSNERDYADTLVETQEDTDSSVDTQESKEKMRSPGKCLRLAREQSGMSVKKAAEELFLDEHVVEGLENDDYKDLPPPIFLRGYLRSYANLIEIPVDSIMESFDREVEEQEQEKKSSSFLSFKQKKQDTDEDTRRDFWPGIRTISVIVVLLVLVALWQFYLNMPDDIPSDIEDPQSEIDEPSNTFQPTTETASTSSVKQPAPVAVDDASRQEHTDTTEDSQKQTMRVHFKERAWIRITDSTEKKLYEGIGNVGEILPLEGIPPFYLKTVRTGIYIEYNKEIKGITTYPKRQGRRNLFIVGE